MAALNSDFESKQQKSKICTLYSNHLYSPQKWLLLVPINSGKKMQIKADYLNELLCYQITNRFLSPGDKDYQEISDHYYCGYTQNKKYCF